MSKQIKMPQYPSHSAHQFDCREEHMVEDGGKNKKIIESSSNCACVRDLQLWC